MVRGLSFVSVQFPLYSCTIELFFSLQQRFTFHDKKVLHLLKCTLKSFIIFQIHFRWKITHWNLNLLLFERYIIMSFYSQLAQLSVPIKSKAMVQNFEWLIQIYKFILQRYSDNTCNRLCNCLCKLKLILGNQRYKDLDDMNIKK